MSAFSFFVKLPFSKSILHKMSELARGKCLAFFTLHRVLEDTQEDLAHPHFLNRTAITLKQAQTFLTRMHRRLPFISLENSLDYLMGRRSLNQSSAVLLIEVPYIKTIRLLKPLLEEQKIPVTLVLATESLNDGRMPWMDEIIYRIGNAEQSELTLSFIDRSLSLNNVRERMAAANLLVEHISHAKKETLKTRLKQLREAVPEVAVHPASERICTVEQIEKLSLNPLFSFASGGKYRLPFYDISLEDAQTEIVGGMTELSGMVHRSLVPVYFYPLGSDKRRKQDIVRLMMDSGLKAAVSRDIGVCRPGDNMFRLHSLPLAQSSDSFTQFEMQGLSDAIDDFLLVTMAKDREL